MTAGLSFPKNSAKRNEILRAGAVIGRRLFLCFLIVFIIALRPLNAAEGENDRRYELTIERNSASRSLTALAQKTKHSILFDFDAVREVETNAVSGWMTLEEALREMLRDTGLQGSLTQSGAISVRAAPTGLEKKTATRNNGRQKTGANIFGARGARRHGALGKDEIIVTGTRVRGKSSTDAMSPVDLYGGVDLYEQGSVDLTDQLTKISPSINSQRFPIADGTTFIRPVSLRNLPPDQTLVLVNGVRRHRSALVNLQVEPLGTLNQGAQAVDFGVIPSIAIKRLEVLRDGASAQYGSDAIAGVLNIILRDNAEGLELTVQRGKFYAGDGESVRFGGNIGLPIGANGFFNLSAEYLNSDITSRGAARPDATQVALARGADIVPFNGLGQRWGDPDVEGYRLFLNTEIEASEKITLYGNGSYADQNSVSDFFYRAPFGVAGVEPRATLCDCDADGNPLPTDQSIVDSILSAGLDPNDFLTADAGSASGFVSLNPIHALLPGGYNPTFGAEIGDYAGVLGLKGDIGNDFLWDISGRFGESKLDYSLSNSINPSLGVNSPFSFRPGGLRQKELGLNADFVYPIQASALYSPVNLAFGAEYRREKYEIVAGDPASFEPGPTALLFGSGSDGFQGDMPQAAGAFRSASYAGYIDIETDLTQWLSVGAAVRYENFAAMNDDDVSWKISARIQPTPWLAVRGTVNTGFRTPTPGQINTLDVTTTANSSGTLVPLGTFPVNGVVATTLGSVPLRPEESFNVAAGVVVTPFENLSLTVDFYEIDVNDRIALSTQNIAHGSPEDVTLTSAGFPGLGQASFFQNAFDTTVRGVDIAMLANFDLESAGIMTLDFRHSWNEQSVDRVIVRSINGERIFDLENQQPNNRSILTVNYAPSDRFDARIRINRYGAWQDFTFGEIARFGSEVLVDIEAAAHLSDRFTIALGAENIFDNFPDNETNAVLTFSGAVRPITSPFGFNGGFWYVRGTARF